MKVQARMENDFQFQVRQKRNRDSNCQLKAVIYKMTKGVEFCEEKRNTYVRRHCNSPGCFLQLPACGRSLSPLTTEPFWNKRGTVLINIGAYRRIITALSSRSGEHRFSRPVIRMLSWGWSQCSPCGICGGHCEIVTGFVSFLHVSVICPVSIIPQMFCIYIYIYI